MYTYIHSNTDDANAKNEEKYENTTINCYSKKNLLNPRCLRKRAVSISNQLTSAIPESIKKIEAQIQQYKSIGNVSKQFIQNLHTNFAKNFVPTCSKNINIKEFYIFI